MRRRVYLLFAVSWILAIPCPLARAALQDDYLKIYLKINEADQYERQGDYKSALATFQDCYQKLGKIHENNPEWESALVVQRMRDCKREIDVLTDKVNSMPEVTPPEVTPAPQPSPTPAPIPNSTPSDTSNDDIATLKLKLSQAEQELNDLKAKYGNVVLENKTLHAQLDAVNQQLLALKSQQSVDDRVGQLMAQNQDLTAKLADAQKQLTDLTSGPKGNSAMLRAQLKTAQDKLVESEAANTALQQTTSVLRQQLDQAQADLTASNQRLASSSSSSPEYATLKHENELMRGILQREVQEQSRRDGAKRLAQEEFDRLKITSKVMQEQLDILGSPMTPPTNDEERTLLASMKEGEPTIQTPDLGGNHLSAPASADTNAPTATPPTPTPDNSVTIAPTTPMDTTPTSTPTTSSTPDTSTNAPVTISSPTSTPSDPTSPATNPSTMTSTSTPDTSTNAPVSITDPSAIPSAPNVPVGSSPAPTISPTTPTTPAPTDVPTPSSTPSADVPAGTTPIPPPTTTITDTTIQNNATPQEAAQSAKTDPTQISTKPRVPDDVRDVAKKASELFKENRLDEAAAAYQTIIDKYPESLYAWSNLGVVRFQQNNLPEALKALQQAVKLSPTDAFSYSNLGIVYYQMNQYESAIEALERALALDPNDAKSHNYLGCACSQKGWQEVAEREFRKAIEIDDTFGDAHFNLALVYATAKPPSLELARRHYNRALELGIGKDARLEKLLAQ